MGPNNRITILIRGMKYHITSREETSYVVGLAHKLDEIVCELTSGPSGVSVNEALVLAAMSSLDSAEKAERNADNLRSQISEYLDDAAKLRLEASDAKRELNKLERKLNEKL